MRISLCKSCGKAYDEDEVNDGYCLECAPDAAMVFSLGDVPNVDEINLMTENDCY